MSVAAGGKLPMYVNLGSSTPVAGGTKFDLARVKSSYRGSTLQLNLWDIGDGGKDANGNPTVASITINPPGRHGYGDGHLQLVQGLWRGRGAIGRGRHSRHHQWDRRLHAQ